MWGLNISRNPSSQECLVLATLEASRSIIGYVPTQTIETGTDRPSLPWFWGLTPNMVLLLVL